MLPLSIRQKVDKIASDTTSGASVIAMGVLEVYTELLKKLREEELRRLVIELGTFMIKAQPSMSIVQNIVESINGVLGDQITSRELLQRRVEELSAHLESSGSKIGKIFCSKLKRKHKIITLSHSVTVIDCLLKAYQAGKVEEVIVAESRPKNEGRKTARILANKGIPTTLVVDAALGPLCRRADMALVGADTVLRDGSIVNKIGTYALALTCHDQQKEFWVVCDTLKIDRKHDSSNPPPITGKSPQEVWTAPPGIEIENFYFDITPAKYIACIITEEGSTPPHKILDFL